MKSIYVFYNFLHDNTFDKQQKEYSSNRYPIDESSKICDNFPVNKYMKDNEDSLGDCWEYVEETFEYSIKSPKEDYPTTFINWSKELEVFEVVKDQDRIMDDTIQKYRPKLTT